MSETLVVDPSGAVRARCQDMDAAAARLDELQREGVEWFTVEPGAEATPAQWRLMAAPVVVFESRRLRSIELGDYVARLDGRIGIGDDEDEAIQAWVNDRLSRPWPASEDCGACPAHASGPHKLSCSLAGAWVATVSVTSRDAYPPCDCPPSRRSSGCEACNFTGLKSR